MRRRHFPSATFRRYGPLPLPDYIDFTVQPFVGSKGRQLRMLLEGFPKREERCTKLSLKSRFVDASTILISVEDRGLGDLHPASGMVIEERISLGKE